MSNKNQLRHYEETLIKSVEAWVKSLEAKVILAANLPSDRELKYYNLSYLVLGDDRQRTMLAAYFDYKAYKDAPNE